MSNDDDVQRPPKVSVESTETKGQLIGDRGLQFNYFIDLGLRHLKRPAYIVLAIVTAIVAAFAVTAVEGVFRGQPPTSGPKVKAGTGAGSQHRLPVLVENVSGIFNTGDLAGDFALPKALTMGAAQYAIFSQEAVPDTNKYTKWFYDHDAAGLSPAIFSITIRGNEPGGARIVNMQLVKHCGLPYKGTIFFYSTRIGGPGPPVKIGFNLDSVDPIPQAMGGTPYGIGNFLGYNYFERHYVNLALGEVATFTMAAITHKLACSFTVQMILATSSGTRTETIANNGRPFLLTAGPSPTRRGYFYSGYRSAYGYIVSLTNASTVRWKKLNPAKINSNVCGCDDDLSAP